MPSQHYIILQYAEIRSCTLSFSAWFGHTARKIVPEYNVLSGTLNTNQVPQYAGLSIDCCTGYIGHLQSSLTYRAPVLRDATVNGKSSY